MANPQKSLPLNSPGDFFVDSTCIDCDTCRQLAPATFADSGDFAYVQRQPVLEEEHRHALYALLSCPTGSIGTRLSHATDKRAARQDFPLLLEAPVYCCGFNSPKSYGGNSYFVRHADGNWLIDSPKFLPYLTEKFTELGGIRYLFLTHRDDVADAETWAKHFGAQRIIHRLELESQPDAEIVIDGFDPVKFSPDFTIIPTPGHTAGHTVLLFRDRFLFTGDHLSWDRQDRCLRASRDYCWHDWAEQTESMARLRDFTFTWVLPGHGQRVALPADVMRRELQDLVGRMREE